MSRRIFCGGADITTLIDLLIEEKKNANTSKEDECSE